MRFSSCEELIIQFLKRQGEKLLNSNINIIVGHLKRHANVGIAACDIPRIGYPPMRDDGVVRPACRGPVQSENAIRNRPGAWSAPSKSRSRHSTLLMFLPTAAAAPRAARAAARSIAGFGSESENRIWAGQMHSGAER